MFDILGNILGFVEIEISGKSCEQFLNLAHKRQISIWNLRYKNQTIIGRIRPKNFIKLIEIKRETKSKVKIIEKKGAVFIINKYKGRRGILIGVILFFAVLKILSLFILGIEVNSNKKVDKEVIMSALSEIGVKEGTVRNKIDTNFAAQKLILLIPDVSWASLNIEGSILNVNIKFDKEKNHSVSPSNIIAEEDGIIEKIDVVSGETKISIGDAVSKGDILVSGVSQNGLISVFEKANGEIIARTKHVFVETDYLKKEKYVDDNRIVKRALKIVNIDLPLYLGSVKQANTSSVKSNQIKILGKKLPITYYKKIYYLKEKKTVEVSKEELTEILKRKIEEKIIKSNYLDYEIISQEVSENNKALTVKATVSALEDIGKESEILFSEK